MPRARAVGIDARWINANGGIAGHPLHVTVCDDGGVASQAAACAREAVSGNDVAVVGSFSIAGDPAIVAILQQAKIAWFAPSAPHFPRISRAPCPSRSIVSPPKRGRGRLGPPERLQEGDWPDQN